MKTLDDFRLKIKEKEYKPIVIGGMGVDISTPELAQVAASLGGIGHISDAMSPYVSDKRFKTRFQQQKSRRYHYMRNIVEKEGVKWESDIVYQANKNYVEAAMNYKNGSSGAVYINIMEKLSMGDAKETLKARLLGALDGGIDGITLSAGLHTGTLSLIKDHPRFHDAALGVIVSSVRALKLLLEVPSVSKRFPDYIVVEGPLAGGHLGFGKDWRNYNLSIITQDILSFLQQEQLDIPVIPAGGIFSGQEGVNFLESGASGIQVATRFTISEECGLPNHVKQRYIAAKKEDVTVTTASPTGYPMRILKDSPSLSSNIKPNCEALGYMLDAKGACPYQKAYHEAPIDKKGRKTPVTDKMCICHHFMRNQCYTCGYNVFRLKEKTEKLSNGIYKILPAEAIFNDYLYSKN